MTENKSYWLILILLSIIFGIIYSLHWLIPFLKYDYYIPINKFIISTGYDDNYFWYSHINNILSGKFILSDPTNKEFENIYTIFNTYNLSALLASIAGIFTQNISFVYNFNYFFFPTLNFIAISLLIKNFVKANHLNFLVTTMVVYFTQPTNIFYFLRELIFNIDNNLWEIISTSEFTSIHANRSNQLHRVPNIMITNLFLILNLYFIINYKDKIKNLFFSFFFIISIGLSIYVSANNFLITYACLLVAIIYELYEKKNLKYLFFISFFSFIISLPGMIVLIKHFFNLRLFEIINVIDNNFSVNEYTKQDDVKFENFIFLFKYLVYLIAVFIAIYKVRFLNKKKLLPLPILIYIIFSISFLIYLGKYYEWRILNRGIIILISISFYISIITLVFYYFKHHNKIYCLILIIVLNSVFFVNQLKYSNNNEYKYNQKDFYLLTNWINNNTSKNNKIVSTDPHLLANLSVYTNVSLYFSVRELSFRTLDELLMRLSNIFFKLGLNEIDLYNFILNEKSPLFSSEMKINIFYKDNLNIQKKKYFYKILKKNFEIIRNKKNIYNFEEYFLIVNLKSNLISKIENKIVNYEKLYDNEKYAIYKFQN